MARSDVIDVSHYQKITDGFAGAKAMGVAGVIQKATEGVNRLDATYLARRWLAQQAGILFGAYHYLKPGTPDTQAQHFIDTVGDAAGMLLALDYEEPGCLLDNAIRWLSYVKAHYGRGTQYPVIYGGGLLKEHLKHATPVQIEFFRSNYIKLWLAQYGAHPQVPAPFQSWWLWQFTGDGNGPGPHDVPGVGMHVDISTFNGDIPTLRDTWATVPRRVLEVTPPAPPVIAPKPAPSVIPTPKVSPPVGLFKRILSLFVRPR